MHRWILVLSCVCVLFASTSGVAQSPSAIDATLPQRLQRVLDSVYARTSAAGKYGISAAVSAPRMDLWASTVGVSHPGTPLRTDHLFEIGSVTKTFTTAAILKLAEEGKLSLDDKISKWLPTYTNINPNITVRQLLDHSSGLFDYVNDDTTYYLLDEAYYYAPEDRYDPEEILAVFVDPPHFAPGTSYRYTNTGFLILGLIIEEVANQPVAQYLRQQFFGPLGLTQTFAGSDETITGDFAHQWIPAYQSEPAADLSFIPRMGHLSLAWTAGYIVSTPTDMAKWSHALYTGQVLNAASMQAMLKMNQWSDGTYYGLGVMAVPYYTRTFVGHAGSILGYEAFMFTNPSDSVTVTLTRNSEPLPNDPSLNNYLVPILQQIYRPGSAAVSMTSKPNVRVFPNPAAQWLTIENFEPASMQLRIVDMLGNELELGKEQLGSNLRLDVRALGRGVYHYIMTNADGVHTGKFVVSR